MRLVKESAHYREVEIKCVHSGLMARKLPSHHDHAAYQIINVALITNMGMVCFID